MRLMAVLAKTGGEAPEETGTPEASAETRDVTARIRTGDSPMRRDEVLAVLQAHRPVFVEQFDVERLTLFGSVARDQAEEGSDLDLLVEFTGAKSRSKAYFGLMFYLEDLLEREIDLVTEPALRREFVPFVESEAIRV